MNPKDFQNPLSENIARIRAYMWMGLDEETESIFEHLNDGYGLHEKYFNSINLPSNIFYYGLKYSSLFIKIFKKI